MSTLNFSQFIKGAQGVLSRHSPEILTGIGIGGMVTTIVFAVKATPKAIDLIEEERNRQNQELRKKAVENHEDTYPHISRLKSTDAVKVAWKCYIPAAVTGALSVACLVGASSVNAKRNAALATAYALSETALSEYQTKVVETIGEKKEQVVRDAIAKDKIDKDPVSNKEVIVTERGNTLCYDAISGRYFKSDIEQLKQVRNELNRRMRDEMYISLNDFYYEIGLRQISIGEELGWNIDKGWIELDFSSQLADDGTPCLVINYSITPRYDYRTLM